MKYYVDPSGAYLYGTDGEPPEGGIEVDPPPEYADQVWLFPGWSESPSHLASIEQAWQEAEMLGVAEQLLKLEDDDPSAKPGTAKQWRDYRIELRKWTEANPDFPRSDKRPSSPG